MNELAIWRPRRNTITQMDALQFAWQIEPRTVQTVITSPPYWGLRSYLPGKVKLRENLPEEIRQQVLAELELLGIEASEHEE